MNVTINDIKDIEQELNVKLTPEQRENLLREYNRIVMDRGDSWDVLIKNLIKEIK